MKKESNVERIEYGCQMVNGEVEQLVIKNYNDSGVRVVGCGGHHTNNGLAGVCGSCGNYIYNKARKIVSEKRWKRIKIVRRKI